MTKITSQEISRWSAWIKKAKELKDKYDHIRESIIGQLNKKKPRFLGEYNYQESLVLLFLLSKVINSQQLLYHRFVNGSNIFLSGINKNENEEYFNLLESVQVEGERLLKRIINEKKVLISLTVFFKDVDQKISERMFNNGTLIEQDVLQAKEKVGERKKEEIKKIKIAHQLVLKFGNEENAEKKRLNSKIDEVKTINYKLFNLIKNDQFLKGASLVYIGGYICFFAGLLDYQTFNELTNLARRSIAIGTNNAGVAF